MADTWPDCEVELDKFIEMLTEQIENMKSITEIQKKEQDKIDARASKEKEEEAKAKSHNRYLMGKDGKHFTSTGAPACLARIGSEMMYWRVDHAEDAITQDN